jgi:hypothetical protein
VLITTVPFKVAGALVEGLKSETVQQNDNAALLFPTIEPISFRQSVKSAINEIEKDQVVSRWCDSSGGEACDVIYQDDPSTAIINHRKGYIDQFFLLVVIKVGISTIFFGGYEEPWIKLLVVMD